MTTLKVQTLPKAKNVSIDDTLLLSSKLKQIQELSLRLHLKIESTSIRTEGNVREKSV